MYIVDTKARPATGFSAADSAVSRRYAPLAAGLNTSSPHAGGCSTNGSYDRSSVLLGERPASSASNSVADAGGDSVLSSARSFRRPPSSSAGQGGGLPPGFVYRSYVMHDYVYHPNLSSLQYASFFNLCRLQGVSFDLHERVGTAFVLVDSLAGGTRAVVPFGGLVAHISRLRCVLGIMGMLSVGRNPVQSSQAMQKALEFIAAQVGARAAPSEFDDEESNFQASSGRRCVCSPVS